ncbi:hypothetical protein ACFL5G_02275, partial [Candidatus Margulisiibacteriota bacterium]
QIKSPQKIQGIPLPADSYVQYRRSGNIFMIRTEGIPLNINGFNFPAHTDILLHDNKENIPIRMDLKEETEVNGLRCLPYNSHGKRESLYFHPNGEIAEAYLVPGQNVQPMDELNNYPYEFVYFHENGQLNSFVPSQPQDIMGIKCYGNTGKGGKYNRISFHDNGSFDSSLLEKGQKINGIKFKEETVIAFYPGQAGELGNIKFGTTAEELPILWKRGKTISIPAGSTIFFDENGRITKITLAEQLKIGRKTYTAGQSILFKYKNNTPNKIVLDEPKPEKTGGTWRFEVNIQTDQKGYR